MKVKVWDQEPFLRFHNNFFHLCLQKPNSSSLLFRLAPPEVNMIWYASVRHSLHTLVVGLNEGALAIMFQLMSCGTFCSFNLHTWCDNLDAVFFLSLMSDRCFLNLSLNPSVAINSWSIMSSDYSHVYNILCCTPAWLSGCCNQPDFGSHLCCSGSGPFACCCFASG